MKSFILLLVMIVSVSFFVSAPVAAGTPWSHVDDFEENKELYLVGPVVSNKEIKYCFVVDDQRLDSYFLYKYFFNNSNASITYGQITKKLYEELSYQIEYALRTWLDSVDQYGVYDKKGAKIDLKKVKITNVDCGVDGKNANIGFWLTSKEVDGGESDAIGASIGEFYIGDTGLPVIYINSDRTILNKVNLKSEKNRILKNIQKAPYSSIDSKKVLTMLYETILHEEGHAFGLADEYLYYDGDRRDKTFSTDYRDVSSVMYSGPILKPNCDDVTGLVFLFDRYSKHSRTMNALCPYEKGVYKDGKKEGEWSVYFMNGKIKYKGTYVQGKKEGLFNYYDPEQSNSYTATYKNNEVINGTVPIYNPRDLILTLGTYKDGKKNGQWLFFDPNYIVKGKPMSILVSDAKYENDIVKEGSITEYYDQEGLIKSICSYKNGKLNGPSEFYTVDGVVGELVIYKNGVPTNKL